MRYHIASSTSLHPPRAFTLVELLVVIGIIALLIAILVPTLGKARLSARTAKCLSNLRNMQVAQAAYCVEHRGYLVQAGFAHGGHATHEQGGWFELLRPYYRSALLLRSPLDDSPHWEQPLTTGGPLRRSSYGINNFLDRELVPWGGPYVKITQVRRSAKTIQFLLMAETGDFAIADHPHIENWVGANVAAKAARQVAIDAAGGGKTLGRGSRSNYGFLDGHAETLPFASVFTDLTQNLFDPSLN